MNRRIWDFWSSRYERLWVQKFSLGPTRREIISRIDRILPPEGPVRILDMGCGTGQLVRELKAAFSHRELQIKGVDISPGMIREARRKDPDTPYEVYSMEGYHDLREHYDVIVCAHSFPYYQDKPRAVEKFFTWLKPGGYLFMANGSVNTLFDAFSLFVISLTTSKAKYPSLKEMEEYLSPKFFVKERFRIQEQFWIASIYLFVCQKAWR